MLARWRSHCAAKPTARSLLQWHARMLADLLNSAYSVNSGDQRDEHTSGNQRPRDGARHPAVDTTHRTPTEQVWPATRQQEKFAARVYASLAAVLGGEDAFREVLVRQLGFSAKAVRVSPDHSKAFILWDSVNGRAAAAAAELERKGPRLRAAVARVLGARSAPRLEFRHDRLSGEEEQLQRVFERLEEERGSPRGGGGGGGERGAGSESRERGADAQ